MYPKRVKKYEVPAGPIETDGYGVKGNPSQQSSASDKPQGPGAGAIASGALELGTMGMQLYNSKKKDSSNNPYGIKNPNGNEMMLESGLKYGQMGSQLGQINPVLGAVGAGVGFVGGMVAENLAYQKQIKENKKLFANYYKTDVDNANKAFKQNTDLINTQAKQQRTLIPSNHSYMSAKRGGIFPKYQTGSTIYNPTSTGTKYQMNPQIPSTPKFEFNSAQQIPKQSVQTPYNYYKPVEQPNMFRSPDFNIQKSQDPSFAVKGTSFGSPQGVKGVSSGMFAGIFSMFGGRSGGMGGAKFTPRMSAMKHGGIFPKLQQGGVTPHAVIPSGPLHSEKNNLGTKGLPVVHSETNEKKAEVEREEIIFTKPQSEVLEKFHKELTANPSDEGYIKFGEIVGKFINGAKDMNDE